MAIASHDVQFLAVDNDVLFTKQFSSILADALIRAQIASADFSDTAGLRR